eukprot:jgi/Hompol1/5239/HPOL_004272-RA
MFAGTAQVKPRSTRTAAVAATAAVTRNPTNENSRVSSRALRTSAKEALAVTAAKEAVKHVTSRDDPAPAATKKRAALGDVANAPKTRTTRSSTNALKATKQPTAVASMPTQEEVHVPAPTQHTRKPTGPSMARLAKKTLVELQGAAIPSMPEQAIFKDRHATKDAGLVPSESQSAVVTESREEPSNVPKPDPEPACEEQIQANDDHVTKKARTVPWDDLDAEDGDDPLMLAEYVDEIFEYMRELEIQTLANPDYMTNQKELQWSMRGILVDWLIEVHGKFRLLAETLYLAVNIIDRFLSMRVVSLAKLQLVGVTAMFIAAKYEEVIAPSIQNFLYMADGGYTDEEILRAERYILQVLDFSLQYPTPMSFLRRCSKADNYDIQTRTLAKYLMEVSLVDHRFIKMPSSMIAAAGLYLARKMLSRTDWNHNLIHFSGYEEREILECVDLMTDYLAKPLKYEALYKKYSARKFMKAAIFVEDWISRNHVSSKKQIPIPVQTVAQTTNAGTVQAQGAATGVDSHTASDHAASNGDEHQSASDEQDVDDGDAHEDETGSGWL